jgi:hypothetical protein
MKHRYPLAIFFCLLLAVIPASFLGKSGRDPANLRYWVSAGGGKDWASEAARNQPEAEFFFGISYIRSNLVVMVDQVPGLCRVPVLGKRFFEKTSYGIDSGVDPETLAQSYRWIKASADQGFAPAKEAEKLFLGKTALQSTNPVPQMEASRALQETNRNYSKDSSRQ